jgi:hypothetical protein
MLSSKNEGRSPLGICRHRLEYNIKVDLKETGFGVVDWIDLAQNRG